MYLKEGRTEAALAAADGDFLIATSELATVEFVSALGIKLRTSQSYREEVEAARDLFSKHVGSGQYIVLPVTNEVYVKARAFLSPFSLTLRTYDALHLATAQIADTPVVTADRNMAEAARVLGMSCDFIE